MVRRDGMSVRRERINKVIQRVLQLLAQSENGEIPLSKTMAKLELEIGARPERIREYLEVGVRNQRFVIDEERDRIVSMKKSFSEGTTS